MKPWEADNWHDSPDIQTVIQEIVEENVGVFSFVIEDDGENKSECVDDADSVYECSY